MTKADYQAAVDRLRETSVTRPDPPAEPPPRARPPAVPIRYGRPLDELEPTPAIVKATAWLRRVRDDTTDDRGLLLLGKVGRGKSAVAGALATEAGAPQHASYWPVLDLFAALRAEFDTATPGLTVRDKIARRRLLVLDDVGAEKPTGWTSGILAELVASAYDDRRLLIVTSNLSPKQLGEHLGQRTVSRLHEMTDMLVVEGPDRRQP